MKEVEIHATPTCYEWCSDPLDIARAVLYDVNLALKNAGVDMTFSFVEHPDDDFPEELWDNDHPEYTGHVITKDV